MRLGVILLALLVLAPHAGLACLDVSAIHDKTVAEGDAAEQRELTRRKELIAEEFPYTREQALEALTTEFPQTEYPMADGKFLEQWLDASDMTCAVIDGEKRYFHGLTKNIAYRNVDLARAKLARTMQEQSPFFDQVRAWVFPPERGGVPRKSWRPYVEPVRYLATFTLAIPRAELPRSGSVRVWMPLPIDTASQRNVRLVSIAPEEQLVAMPRQDAPQGLACFDIPLEGREMNLNIEATLLFDSYVQRFTVDPAKVLPYQKESEVWQTYTRPGPNIVVTPEIEARAREASKGERNPWLAARNIYAYIVDNISYSLSPHATLMILGHPEALWVHEVGHGDCGAQSMYFAALCRALGIPARATGGYQLFPGLSGTHFWAEVYIEGHGWVPLDPTVAEASDWSGAIDEAQRRDFKDFYFGNLDPFRMVIQRDVDIQLVPEPTDNFMTGERPLMVMQMPWLDCPDCETSPVDLVGRHFSWKAVPVDR
jgi:transglutaminase-like putative cysteine protease